MAEIWANSTLISATNESFINTSPIFFRNETSDLPEVNTTVFPGEGNSTVSIDTTTPKTELEWQDLRNNFNKAQYVIFPVLFLGGVVGNTLSIITLSHPKFQHQTSRYILIALALSDTTLLLTQTFNRQFTMTLLGQDIRGLTKEGCKAFFVIFRTSKMSSSWFVVLLCVERFVAIMFPFKAKQFLRKKTILPAVVIVYVVMFTFNGSWTYASDVHNGKCRPDIATPEMKETYKRMLLAATSLYSFIPMTLLLVLTPPLIIRLAVTRKKREEMAQANVKSRDSSTRISVMLIGVVVIYVICIMPITVLHNVAFWMGVSAFDTATKSFYIFREIAQILEQVNYSVNFLMYVMCSRQFRERLAELFRCHKKNLSRQNTAFVSVTSPTLATSTHVE